MHLTSPLMISLYAHLPYNGTRICFPDWLVTCISLTWANQPFNLSPCDVTHFSLPILTRVQAPKWRPTQTRLTSNRLLFTSQRWCVQHCIAQQCSLPTTSDKPPISTLPRRCLSSQTAKTLQSPIPSYFPQQTAPPPRIIPIYSDTWPYFLMLTRTRPENIPSVCFDSSLRLLTFQYNDAN